MGKVIAREFLWFFLALLACIPLGLVFLWFFAFTGETINLDEIRKNYIFWLYVIGCIVSFLGIYIVRFVAMAFKTLTEDAEYEEEE